MSSMKQFSLHVTLERLASAIEDCQGGADMINLLMHQEQRRTPVRTCPATTAVSVGMANLIGAHFAHPRVSLLLRYLLVGPINVTEASIFPGTLIS